MLVFAITSKTLPLTQVEDITDIRLAQKLSQVSGVGLVSVAGGQRPALRVEVNPRALAAYGLAIDDIRTDITNQNTDLPKGNFDGPSQNSTINDNDQMQTAEDYRRLIIAYRNGAAVQAVRCRDGGRGAGKRRTGGLGEQDPGDHPQRQAPAGLERHRRGRRGEGAIAQAARRPCRPAST